MLLFASTMFSAGLNLEQLSDRLPAISIGLFFCLVTVWLLLYSSLNLFGKIKVMTSERSLVIQNALSRYSINWEDIAEFGTYKHWHIRAYYLKTKRYGDRKIQVCNEYLQELDQLIETVFLKATYAKCLWIENTAMIPFTRRKVVVPWERKTRIGS